MTSDSDRTQSLSLDGVLRQDHEGEVYLQGHRITLHDVVHLYNEGYSVEMLVAHFPTLALAHVHKVIAFYLEHRQAVDAYGTREVEAVAKLRADSAVGPTLNDLRRRLGMAQAG